MESNEYGQSVTEVARALESPNPPKGTAAIRRLGKCNRLAKEALLVEVCRIGVSIEDGKALLGMVDQSAIGEE